MKIQRKSREKVIRQQVNQLLITHALDPPISTFSPGSGNPIFASWIGHSSKQSVLEQANGSPWFSPSPLFSSCGVAWFLSSIRSNPRLFSAGWTPRWRNFHSSTPKWPCTSLKTKSWRPTGFWRLTSTLDVHANVTHVLCKWPYNIYTAVFMHISRVHTRTRRETALLNIQASVQISNGRLKIDISLDRSFMSLSRG